MDGQCLLFHKWPSEEFKAAFGVVLICIQFFIPFIVLVYCYGHILFMLSKRVHRYRAQTTTMQNLPWIIESNNNTISVQGQTCEIQQQCISTPVDRFQLARRNTIKTFVIVACCFVVCWSQNQVYYLMHHIGHEVDWNSTYYHVTITMVFLNSTVNPFVYLILYKDYQVALKQFVHGWCDCGSQLLFAKAISSKQRSVNNSP